MHAITVQTPDERWAAAFVCWMQRTGAADFTDDRECHDLFGPTDGVAVTYTDDTITIQVQPGRYE